MTFLRRITIVTPCPSPTEKHAPEVTGSRDHKTALRTAAASIASIGHLVVSFEIQAPKGLVSDLTSWLSWSFGGEGQRMAPFTAGYREGR